MIMRSERILIDGPAGAIETVFDYPPGASEVAPRGIAPAGPSMRMRSLRMIIHALNLQTLDHFAVL